MLSILGLQVIIRFSVAVEIFYGFHLTQPVKSPVYRDCYSLQKCPHKIGFPGNILTYSIRKTILLSFLLHSLFIAFSFPLYVLLVLGAVK